MGQVRTILLTLIMLAGIVFPAAGHASLLFYASSNNMVGTPSNILKVFNDGTSSVWNITWDRAFELYDPRGIAIDSAGNVYVNDSQYILKIDPSGNGTVFATKPSDSYGYGVTVDALGNVYSVGAVGFYYGIYKYDASGQLIDTWTLQGQSLSNLAIGHDGYIYSGDTFAGAVYRFDPADGSHTVYASVDSAGDVAFAPDGTLYVGSYKAVYQVADDVVSVALNRRVYQSYGLGVDADGTLYIGNNRSNWDNEILSHQPGSSTASYTIFADLTEEQTITGIAMVPEPSTVTLLVIAGAFVVFVARSRSRFKPRPWAE
ncbi:PEP-CTERM protein-sorting domain-containing protein [Terrimicrobium sacchariphilum]|uniref:PEP-CTERM protein-sorting domain-containing protein n=1 Tax=Terrimicrobium sacchariphilum TaxID=690879 RepID=A0A146GGB6_TERSA|nr:PEP-CTERM sorting domain-containing protein [Terrimicrobium sacchariphilum]GAT35488.1 PEP-CTERM protein-sorting domain-containing protein [Terrimicrobium sacchariphilum]